MPERAANRPFPAFDLAEAMKLAQAIQDSNAGKPMNRLLLAGAIGRKSGSSEYRLLLSSANKYGLTKGNESSKEIALTPLGHKVTHPTSEQERISSIRAAALAPETFGRIFRHYDNAKFPSGTFFRNALESEFGVPREHTEECERMLNENGKLAGIIVQVSGSPHVILEAGGISPAASPPSGDASVQPVTPEGPTEEPGAEQSGLPSVPEPPRNAIFIGHGSNRRPVEQLRAILDQYKIPYKTAIEEPNRGRPISQKVADTMKECGAAILIFTADEELRTKAGEPIWKPSQNVVHELGAASILYGGRIVVFKEDAVDFPSNFKDLGYISFPKDDLSSKTNDLFKELIAFGLIRVSVGG